MPRLYVFGQYVIFFWVGENGEPVHVHVSVKRPEKDSTKIWLTRSGGALLAHNASRIPQRDLNNILDFITYNHSAICERWHEVLAKQAFAANRLRPSSFDQCALAHCVRPQSAPFADASFVRTTSTTAIFCRILKNFAVSYCNCGEQWYFAGRKFYGEASDAGRRCFRREGV
ncbi:MAG TPA: DUF4160 domain-containing protein [Candidatus Rubneribacter avistercoris]|nr:DUF4160 domain-containing protein [Candidatus Rubneribacter avistercoris]